MEVSLLRGSNSAVEKPTLRSNPAHSPTSTPDELILAEQESDSCKHFTIRGFVSEVRKRNAKICWPFSMLSNTLDEDVNPLRPLSVKKFRQWGCQNCVREIINPKTSIPNGANANQKDEVKNKSTLLLRDDTKVSHRKTTKSLDRFLPQSDQENNLEGIVVQDDNSTRIITGGWCPLSCCSKQDGTSRTTDSPKGDMRVSKLGYHGLKGNWNLRGKPDAVAAEEQSSVRANSSEISLLSKGTPKRERTALIHRTSGVSATSEQVLRSLSFSAAASNIKQKQGLIKLGKRKESDGHFSEGRLPPRVDSASPDNGALPASSAHESQYNSMESDECSDEASDTSVPLIRDLLACKNDDRKLGMSMEKSRTRRSRKMRALDDIMKSQRIESDEKNCISSDIGGPSGSGNNEIPAVSEQRNDNANHGNHLIPNNEPTSMKKKNKKESIPNDGEGICLIRWLKKAPKKVSLHRGLEESSRIDTATSSKKVLDLNVPLSGPGENKQETTAEKDQNMTEVEVLKSSFMIPEGSTAHKGCAISDQDPQAKNSHPKSVGIIISEKRRSQQLETHDNAHKKSPVSYKKIKGTLAEDESFSQQWFEDSLGTQKQPGFQVQGEAKKKEKSMRILEQEAGDSIPMDIVELLAKKQQERHLTNSRYDSADMSRPLKIARHTMNSNVWDSTEVYSSKESEASHRCLYQEGQCNIAGNGCWTSVRNNGDGECRPIPYHSYMRDKHHYQFDLNQEAPACSVSDLHASSPYIGLSMSGGQLIVDTGRNYSPRRSSINGMQIPSFLPHHTDMTVSPDHNLFRNALDGPYGLQSCPSQINTQKSCSNLQSNIMYLRENPKALAPDIRHQTSVYPSRNWAESSNPGGALAAKRFGDSAKAYYSNVRGPVDLHNNETISASNLLRLIQQSASLGEPCHPLIHYDSIGHIRALNGHGSDLLGPARDPKVCSRDYGNNELDKRAANLCRPLRPLPRFGILGPLLQKEVTNTSLSSALGFGASIPCRPIFCQNSSIAGQTDALASYGSILKGEPEAYKLAPVTKVLNAQTSSSQCEGSTRIDSSGPPLGNPQRYLAKDSIRQVVTGSRDGAFQPVRSTCKTAECLVNRNPADFAMPDEDSEYMIGYQEKKAEDTPLSGSQPLQSHLHGRKGQKMRKLNDLNLSRMSNKSPSRRLSFTRKAT